MIEQTMIFVDAKSGTFEGKQYSNVILSDGIASYKFPNPGLDTSNLVHRQSKVNATFEMKPGQNSVCTLALLKLAVVK